MESQYYNADFTEFDLEITNYYFKVRKKLSKHHNLSIAYMKSEADNISYMNGLLSTDDKDRSYVQDKVYTSFSISDVYFLGKKISTGIYSSFESRDFTSDLEEDRLHFKRSHNDVNLTYWFKRHLNNQLDVKIKAVHRKRTTSSPYYTESVPVSDFKSFEKFEVWLSIIFRMELNVY